MCKAIVIQGHLMENSGRKHSNMDKYAFYMDIAQTLLLGLEL